MENQNKSIFEVLSQVDCSKHIEKKDDLSYLSWAWAWGITKKHYPSLSYKVIEYDGKPYLFDKTLGYLVTTEVTIDGETLSMRLPVMNGANKAQKDEMYEYETKYGKKKVEAATMFDINTAIMRCLTKNLALFGLGHYIYAGEDLPVIIETNEEKVAKETENDNRLFLEAKTFTNIELFTNWYKVNINKVVNQDVENQITEIGKVLKEKQNK